MGSFLHKPPAWEWIKQRKILHTRLSSGCETQHTYQHTQGEGSIFHVYKLFLLVPGGDTLFHTCMSLYPHYNRPWRIGLLQHSQPRVGPHRPSSAFLLKRENLNRRDHLAPHARRFQFRESLFEVLLTNAFGRFCPFSVFTAYLFWSLHLKIKSTFYTNCFSVTIRGWVRLNFGGQGQRGRRTSISSSLWKNVSIFSHIITKK